MTMRRNLEENRSTPLHLTARSGSIDSVRKLLASGADRLQRDASGYYKHYEDTICGCHEIQAQSLTHLLQRLLSGITVKALMDANREREKTILNGTTYSLPSPPSFSDTASDDDNLSE
uniref:Uncharacterized protein n=3 Tax=Brassica TaxID=3705 RepID=A0A0D3ANL1_BRAOL